MCKGNWNKAVKAIVPLSWRYLIQYLFSSCANNTCFPGLHSSFFYLLWANQLVFTAHSLASRLKCGKHAVGESLTQVQWCVPWLRKRFWLTEGKRFPLLAVEYGKSYSQNSDTVKTSGIFCLIVHHFCTGNSQNNITISSVLLPKKMAIQQKQEILSGRATG